MRLRSLFPSSSLALLLAVGACGGEPNAPDAGAADAASPDGGRDPSAPELYLHYPLDGDAVEATGSGKDGVVTGGSAAPDRAGAEGRALRLDAANSVVTIGGVDLRAPFSVSLWWDRAGAGAPDPGCLGGEETAVLFAGYRFLLALGPGATRLAYAVDHEPAPPLLVDALATAAPPDGWHHLVLVDRVTSGELWLDGALVETGTIADTERHASFLTLGGHPSWPCGLQGTLDEVRLYRGALDAAAVGALHQR